MKFGIAILFVFFVLRLAGQSTFFRVFDVQNDSPDRGWDLLVIEDGYLIATGSLCWEDDNPSCTGLIKCDWNGDLIWKKVFEGKRQGHADALVSLLDGNYAIAGDKFLDGDDFSIFLMKIDGNSGDSLWVKYFNSPFADYARTLATTSSGDLVIAGDGDSSGNGQPENTIIKTSPEGDLIFHKDYPDIFRQSQFGNLEILSTGELLRSFDASDWNSSSPWNTLTKIDSFGKVIWTKRYYKQDFIFPFTFVRELTDGTYVLFGSRDTFISGNPVYLPFLKIDTSGNVLNEFEIYKGDYDNELSNVVLDAEGNLLASGRAEYVELGKDVAWLLKISPQGQILWQRHFWDESFPPGTTFWFEDVGPTPWGGIAISGTIKAGQPDGDAFLLVLDENGCFEPGCDSTIQFLLTTSSEVVSDQEIGMQVFPNPATKEVFLKTNQTGKGELSIFDLTGKLQLRKRIEAHDQQERLDVSFLPAGAYYLTFQSDKNHLFHQKLIISK